VLLIALGSFVMFGWVLHQPTWVQLSSHYVGMTFNAAFCFVLLGAGMWAANPTVRNTAAALAVALATLVFMQYVLGVDLSVDRWIDARWLQDTNPYPGRMAPQTAIGVVLAAAALCLLESQRRGAMLGAQILILLVGVAGLLSVIGYSLRLELLYSWHRYTRMAFHTAGGFTVLAMGLWLRWFRNAARHGAFAEREERRITVIGTAIIMLIGTSAGAMGFVLLAQETEKLGFATLTRGVEDRAQILRTVLDARAAHVAALARDPHWRSATPAELAVRLEEVRREPISALAMLARDGSVLAATGPLEPPGAMSIALSDHEVVYWHDGLFLITRVPIDAQRVLAVRQDLAVWQKVIAGTQRWSASGDLQICAALTAQRMRCLPSRLQSSPSFSIPRVSSSGVLPMGLALLGQHGQMAFVSAEGRRATGAYQPLLGTPLGLVLHQDNEELYMPIRSKLPVLLLVLATMLAGGVALLRSQLAPLIRALMQAHTAAAINAHRVATIMDNVPDGIITSDVHGSIVSINPAVCRLFGYQETELIGSNVRRLIPARFQVHEAGVRQLVGRGPTELIACRHDGSEFPMELTLNTMQMEGAQFFVGIMHDITQRREVERLKSEFVSVVSHELRTPLTSIRGSLGLLAGGAAGAFADRAQQLVDIAYRNSISLSALIDDILDVEKAEAGRMTLDFQMQALAPLLSQAIDTNAGYAHQFHVQLELRDEAVGAQVNVDGARLLQVLANLLSNASKFSPSHSRVILTATWREQCVRICVIDHGSGIPPEFKTRIFEKFSQADGSDRRKKGGTGLGLAISRAIVEAMGGAIGFESPANGGTLFFVELPCATPAIFDSAATHTLSA
jgi:PAS domain S-box-containing protein